MKNILIASLIGGALAIGAFVVLRPSEPTYADLRAQQLRVEQMQATAPAWVIASWLLIVGIPVLLLGAGGVALWRFRNERKVDALGRLPIVRSDVSTYQMAAMAA